jgi:hypothetical protein
MEDVSTEATDVRRDPLRYNTLAYEIHLMKREHVFDLFVDFGGHPQTSTLSTPVCHQWAKTHANKLSEALKVATTKHRTAGIKLWS